MTQDHYIYTAQLLQSNFANANYRWHQFKTGSRPRIFTENFDTKNAIMHWLCENQIEFNSYAEKGCRRRALLLRGLIHGNDATNIALIADEIQNAGLGDDIVVSRFITGHMKRNPEINVAPIYQVVVGHDTPIDSFAEIKNIGHYGVRFELMKPSAVIQCHRCQRFAHTATLCGHRFRCVKCTTDHNPGECPRTTDERVPLGCINCATAGLPQDHSANDLRNCGFYAKIEAAKTKTKHTDENIGLNGAGKSAQAQTQIHVRNAQRKRGVRMPTESGSLTNQRHNSTIIEGVRANRPTPRNRTNERNRREQNGHTAGINERQKQKQNQSGKGVADNGNQHANDTIGRSRSEANAKTNSNSNTTGKTGDSKGKNENANVKAGGSTSSNQQMPKRKQNGLGESGQELSFQTNRGGEMVRATEVDGLIAALMHVLENFRSCR